MCQCGVIKISNYSHPIIEKGFFFFFILLSFIGIFVKNQGIILSGFWTFYSVPLTYLSILMPITHLITIALQYVLKYGSVNPSLFLFILLLLFLLFLLLQDCFGCLDLLHFV